MAGKEDDIERYRKGQLSPKERNALEKKALSDPFLDDALEGSHVVSSEEFTSDVSELAKKIGKKSSNVWMSPLRIAAGLVILLSAASLVFWIDLSEPATLALEKSSTATPDSIVNKDKADSSPSLLSLDKPKAAPPGNENVVQESSVKKAKPSTRKKQKPGLSGATWAASKTSEAEIAKNDQAVAVVTEEKIAEVPIVETAPVVAQDETKKESDKLSIPKLKKAVAESRGESIRADFVATPHAITGQVTSEDGSPLPGVNVLVKGTTTGTVTDSNGKFELSTDIANPQLAFSFIGMYTVEVKPEQGSPLKIEMKDDASQLSEVVVTGYGGPSDDREPVIKSAYPVGGIRAYNKYLEANLRYPAQALESKIKGKVTVEFTIATNGDLSEFNVLKGLGYGCDEEVIRLVKEGPKWNPTTVDNTSVETQVRVKMKFDPAKAKK